MENKEERKPFLFSLSLPLFLSLFFSHSLSLSLTYTVNNTTKGIIIQTQGH